MLIKRVAVITAIFLLLLNISNLSAQEERPIPVGTLQCGDIVEGEIVSGVSQITINPLGHEITLDDYFLQVAAGTTINLTVSPLGRSFNVGFALLDSGYNDVFHSNAVIEGEPEELIDYPLGSSNQVLRILGTEPGNNRNRSDRYFYENGGGNDKAGLFFGAYEIRLGCMQDGVVIEPGDALRQPESESLPPAPAFSGYGFPGITPVDFASAFRLPLAVGAQSEGEIPAAGTAVLGFYFTGNAGDTLDLSFERVSGNLNLGLVVLSADNQVAYMSALVSSQTMSSRFSLPSSGEYTVGIFRIDLIPPAAPEATRFRLTAELNP